jgi:hypothetical protein
MHVVEWSESKPQVELLSRPFRDSGLVSSLRQTASLRQNPKKSFKYSGAKLWNSLSREAKEAQSIHIFKQNYINL